MEQRHHFQGNERARIPARRPGQCASGCLFCKGAYLAAAFAALRAAPLGSTAALNFEPAVNFGTVVAAIFSAAPVLGFLPVRAARLTDLKVPNPTRVTVSPFLTAVSIVSMNVSRIRLAAAFENSGFLETSFSMRSEEHTSELQS